MPLLQNFALLLMLAVAFTYPTAATGSSSNKKCPTLPSPMPNTRDVSLTVGLTFDYLLGMNTPIKPRKVDVIVLDYESGVKLSDVQALQKQGYIVLCYVDVGTREDWRCDANLFEGYKPSVYGNQDEGWSSEEWLDIRRLDILYPIMKARFERCKSLGFDGIDPDNVDAYTNKNTGFDFNANDQLNYNMNISATIRNLGMKVGLKNDNGQASQLVTYYDFAIVESCAYDDTHPQGGTECAEFEVFIDNHKPVFAVEYIQSDSSSGSGSGSDESGLWSSQGEFDSSVCGNSKFNKLNFAYILQNLELQTNYIMAC